MEHHHLLEVEGVHVSRREDLRLIRGAGKYASDWNLPGQLYAYFLRADRAHAKILSIDTAASARQPGVVRIYTGEDIVRAGYVKPMTMLTFKGKGGMELRLPQRPALAHGRVRCVGEPVAMVVAESRYLAEDAAAQVGVDYELLPVVADCRAAASPDSPPVRRELDPASAAEQLLQRMRGE